MSDLITFTITGIFGVVSILVIMLFLLIRQQTGKPRFETQDYYKSYKRGDGHYGKGNPFKPSPMTQDRKEQRSIAMAVAAVALIAVLVSIFFDVFEGMLVIFLLPIVVRFIRMKSEGSSDKNRAKDESRSSY
ncbi:MAG: hypothetical protein JRN20_10495 [Nitrososphaerota archaeon]|nr:hypothetical protein [Nitrososphaerota archaeon]